jgi:tRNA (cmo5U34)-methyltransferase
MARATSWSPTCEELFREARGDDERRRAYDEREDRQANILARVELQCGWLSELGFASVDIHFKWLEFALFGGRRPA